MWTRFGEHPSIGSWRPTLTPRRLPDSRPHPRFFFCWDGKRGLVLARGKFSRADIEIGSSFDYKNHRLFGDESGAVVLLNDSTVAAGPAGELRSLIDREGNRGLPPALTNLSGTLPASDQIYAALTGGLRRVDSQPAAERESRKLPIRGQRHPWTGSQERSPGRSADELQNRRRCQVSLMTCCGE